MQQAVDALWKCIYHQRPTFWNQAKCISIFCVRLLQFARSTLPGRVIPEPLIAGRATCTALTLSFYNPLFNAKEESPVAQGIIL